MLKTKVSAIHTSLITEGATFHGARLSYLRDSNCVMSSAVFFDVKIPRLQLAWITLVSNFSCVFTHC